MDSNIIEIFGLMAGAVTSIGFIPQLIKGYKTKKLDDITYFMPLLLVSGMTLWLIYGFLIESLAVMIANTVGVGCNLSLAIMKKIYS
ncbi:MAG: hypothetical protein DRO67_10335 [Candidatus Asgardarchaeum californiense]|nr:MAG: hypothetical protein DRO67_10335 [Candidatus Asgardarchaeum californiense]